MKRAIPLITKKVPVFLIWAWLLLPVSSFAVNLAAVPAQWTPPGSTVPITMWGFISDPGSCPSSPVSWNNGPILTATPGATLTIQLRNCLPEPVSLIIPGQPANLAPQTLPNGRVRSFTYETASNGGIATYTWNNVQAGTYLYQSGTHPAKQVQMGLYGALTVVNNPGANKEILLLYSEIDPALHDPPAPATPMTYKPKYFLINGKSYAPGQPVPAIPAGNSGKTVLIRFVNAGLMSHVPVLEGPYMRVIAEDGNPYPYPREQYSLLMAAGKTRDVLWTPEKPGEYALYDRALSLSSNGMAGGGMLVHLTVEKFPWILFIPAITGANGQNL